jgi:hypothetical protein
VWLFSDGNDAELADILKMPAVQRLHFGSALADMLAMSRSNVLVVSSTFSMWSSFLGAVPSIYYPGQRHQTLLPDYRGAEIEREWGEALDTSFMEVLQPSVGEGP